MISLTDLLQTLIPFFYGVGTVASIVLVVLILRRLRENEREYRESEYQQQS